MRPLRLTLATRPSMTAPRYCAGSRTVIVKRSPVCVVRLVRSVFIAATIISPSRMA